MAKEIGRSFMRKIWSIVIFIELIFVVILLWVGLDLWLALLLQIPGLLVGFLIIVIRQKVISFAFHSSQKKPNKSLDGSEINKGENNNGYKKRYVEII